MLKTCLMFMMILSTMMNTLNNPMLMGLMLLTQTIFGCLVTRFLAQSSWLPLTMFLMMISGLMIIFMYMSSICSNNKFKVNTMKPLIINLPVIVIIFNLHTLIIKSDNLNMKDFFNMEFIKLYTTINIHTSLFMFIYLLLILIIMINLMSKSKGPLRKNN